MKVMTMKFLKKLNVIGICICMASVFAACSSAGGEAATDALVTEEATASEERQMERHR